MKNLGSEQKVLTAAQLYVRLHRSIALLISSNSPDSLRTSAKMVYVSRIKPLVGADLSFLIGDAK